MKISVIIPAHNEEAFIGKTLEAILNQTHKDYEVIVVDNLSTDRTYEVARSFENRPVKVTVIKESKKGTMPACEAGRAIATGELIARLDADCLPETDWLERADWLFSGQPQAVALSGPYEFYDSGSLFRAVSLWEQKHLYGLASDIMQWLRLSAASNGGNSVFRASALQAIGGFNREIEFYGDETDTNKRLIKVGKIVFDPNFVMKTSARRFKKEGMMRTQARYIYHFFRETFT